MCVCVCLCVCLCVCVYSVDIVKRNYPIGVLRPPTTHHENHPNSRNMRDTA